MTDEIDRALRRGEAGLREAFARYTIARRARLDDHASNAAVEAAMWVTALDDLREQTSGDVGRYRARRDADDNGCVVLGLRWVRNHGVHALVNHQQWSEDQGFNFPLNFPANAEWHIRWGPIPSQVQRRKDDARSFDGYVQQLQGHWVDDTLQAAARWLGVMLVAPGE